MGVVRHYTIEQCRIAQKYSAALHFTHFAIGEQKNNETPTRLWRNMNLQIAYETNGRCESEIEEFIFLCTDALIIESFSLNLPRL